MSLSKSRLLAIGLAGLAGAAALGVAAHLRNAPSPSAAATGLAAKAPVQVAEKQTEGAPVEAPEKGRSVHVEAPSTSVDVDKERGRVRVKAPHTDVRVDPDKRRLQVRAPYVDLDIRW